MRLSPVVHRAEDYPRVCGISDQEQFLFPRDGMLCLRKVIPARVLSSPCIHLCTKAEGGIACESKVSCSRTYQRVRRMLHLSRIIRPRTRDPFAPICENGFIYVVNQYIQANASKCLKAIANLAPRYIVTAVNQTFFQFL